MKKLLLIIFMPFVFMGFSTDKSEEANAHIKATYFYNFTKYIEWPQSYQDGNFIIVAIGASQTFVSELNKMAGANKAGNQKFEIRSVSSLENIGKCHILYVAPEHKASINEIQNKLKGTSTLIVTEKPGMAKQGAAINFIILNNKQKFELNKSIAEKYNLKVSSTLASVAVKVD